MSFLSLSSIIQIKLNTFILSILGHKAVNLFSIRHGSAEEDERSVELLLHPDSADTAGDVVSITGKRQSQLSHSNNIATRVLNENLMSNLYNGRVTNVVDYCMDIAQFVVLCMFYFLKMNPSSSTFISLDTLCFELLLLLMLLLLLFLLLLLLLLLLPCLFLIITLYMYVDSVLFGFTEQGRVYPEGDHARVP